MRGLLGVTHDQVLNTFMILSVFLKIHNIVFSLTSVLQEDAEPGC